MEAKIASSSVRVDSKQSICPPKMFQLEKNVGATYFEMRASRISRYIAQQGAAQVIFIQK